MSLSIALLHYPMVNKDGNAVATSVTNFDIHDIARAARTYGVDRYFIVTPIKMQRDFVERIVVYWRDGAGAQHNPTRGDALQNVEIVADLVAVGEAIARESGSEPLWVATSARATKPMMSAARLRQILAEGAQNVCLLFGTGYGLHAEVLELVDATLEPLQGPTDFNHLSVRSAVSIYLDRLLGRSGEP